MAAVTNFNPGAGVMSDVDFATLVDKTLDEVRVQPNMVTTEGEKYLVKQTSMLKEYKIGEVTSILDLPPENEDGDNIPLMVPPKGFSKTITTVNYRAGIMITDDMKSTDYHRKVGAMIVGLPMSVKQRREYLYVAPFNDGITGSTFTGADGVAMFSDSHPHRDPEFGTWDNLLTAAAPSQAAITLAWRSMQNLTNDKGHPCPVNLKRIVTGVTQWTEFKRLLSSAKEAENSLNAENIWNGVIELDAPWHYLTSTALWMGYGDMPKQFDGVIRVVRVPENYKRINVSSNPDLIYGRRVKFSEAVDLLHGRNWVGNAGA